MICLESGLGTIKARGSEILKYSDAQLLYNLLNVRSEDYVPITRRSRIGNPVPLL